MVWKAGDSTLRRCPNLSRSARRRRSRPLVALGGRRIRDCLRGARCRKVDPSARRTTRGSSTLGRACGSWSGLGRRASLGELGSPADAAARVEPGPGRARTARRSRARGVRQSWFRVFASVHQPDSRSTRRARIHRPDRRRRVSGRCHARRTSRPPLVLGAHLKHLQRRSQFGRTAHEPMGRQGRRLRRRLGRQRVLVPGFRRPTRTHLPAAERLERRAVRTLRNRLAASVRPHRSPRRDDDACRSTRRGRHRQQAR
jgi:hypothetical protein